MAEAARSLQAETAEAGRSGSIEDVALIEEYVDSGLAALLDGHEPRYRFDRLPIDSIPDRFTIHLSQPLPGFDSGNAKAYAATCHYLKDRPIYALVLDNKLPYRTDQIEAMKALQHPGVLTLHEAAHIRLSNPSEVRMVLFFDRPRGRTLAELIASGQSFNEPFIIRTIITPLCEALMAMRDIYVHHGRIHPSNIYLDERLQIGECLSEPCGVRQELLYEPIQRALSDPMGKGPATSQSDAYAIGILAYELLYGLQRFREVDSASWLRYVLEMGVYHVLLSNKEPSEAFTDFFRGTLPENLDERWGIEQVNLWCTGKRFNLIHPSLPNESTRPFLINDTNYFNRRALAHAIHKNWNRAAKDVRHSKLDRWLETSAHHADIADRVERIIRTTGGENSNNVKMNNECLSRVILSLDPMGPIRMDRVAFNVDGAGTATAYFYRQSMQQELNLLSEIIDLDLINYAAEFQEEKRGSATSSAGWKLQNLRAISKMKGIGFGIERVLYALNPGFACQSELLAAHHVTTLDDALYALDALAIKHAHNTSLLDRHLCAFLASRIDLNKEITFSQLAKFPVLRDNPELKAMRILAAAQEKAGRHRLLGLATWAAMRVEKLADNIHNRRARKQLRQSLKSAANTGYISHVLAALIESDVTKDDYTGFAKASMLYARNVQRIETMENPKTVDSMSKDLGARIAVFVAYLVLSITVYILIDQYYI